MLLNLSSPVSASCLHTCLLGTAATSATWGLGLLLKGPWQSRAGWAGDRKVALGAPAEFGSETGHLLLSDPLTFYFEKYRSPRLLL